jgi:glycosyltransferase involved in cell wall biosynthesis
VRNPFDVEAFAGAVATLLENPALRARMGAAGRARLEAHFTMPRLTAEFLEEYRTAIDLARAPAGRG